MPHMLDRVVARRRACPVTPDHLYVALARVCLPSYSIACTSDSTSANVRGCSSVNRLVQHFRVLARMTPALKEELATLLMEAGKVVLM